MIDAIAIDIDNHWSYCSRAVLIADVFMVIFSFFMVTRLFLRLASLAGISQIICWIISEDVYDKCMF